MRTIIESTLVSLDGVFESPHIWATEYFDHEAEKYALDLLSASDAMLMGRKTYEFFAAAFPHQKGDYGRRINEIQKYVFSNSLKKADWGPFVHRRRRRRDRGGEAQATGRQRPGHLRPRSARANAAGAGSAR
jgi:hypothetical protein